MKKNGKTERILIKNFLKSSSLGYQDKGREKNEKSTAGKMRAFKKSIILVGRQQRDGMSLIDI